MPAERGEEVMRLCLDTARTTLSERPPDFVRNESAETALPDQKTQLSKWGAGLKLACPLLSDCICTLYTDRPIVCREHIVTGSAVKCETEVADEPQIVPMPVSILECLGELAAELEQSEIECVMLPLALPWAQDNLERSERTWSAVAMVECFGEIVKAKASEKSAAVIAEIQHSHF